MKRFSILALLCGLSACVQYTPLDTPPEQVKFSSRVASQNIASHKSVEIRTKGLSAGKAAELSGVPCRVQGVGYSVDIVTPAKVSLPTYLGKTEDAKVTCRTNAASASASIPAINLTEQSIKSSSSSGGPLAAILVAAVAKGVIAASRDATKDKYGYPTRVVVDMEAQPK